YRKFIAVETDQDKAGGELTAWADDDALLAQGGRAVMTYGPGSAHEIAQVAGKQVASLYAAAAAHMIHGEDGAGAEHVVEAAAEVGYGVHAPDVAGLCARGHRAGVVRPPATGWTGVQAGGRGSGRGRHH